MCACKKMTNIRYACIESALHSILIFSHCFGFGTSWLRRSEVMSCGNICFHHIQIWDVHCSCAGLGFIGSNPPYMGVKPLQCPSQPWGAHLDSLCFCLCKSTGKCIRFARTPVMSQLICKDSLRFSFFPAPALNWWPVTGHSSHF